MATMPLLAELLDRSLRSPAASPWPLLTFSLHLASLLSSERSSHHAIVVCRSSQVSSAAPPSSLMSTTVACSSSSTPLQVSSFFSFVQELRRAPLLSSQLTTPPSQAPARLRRVPSHFTAEPEPPESPLPSSSCASVPESGAAASTAAEFHAPRLRPEHQSSPRAAAPPRAEPPPVLPGAATEHVHLVVMPEHAK
jgi:hypothetical protein